MSMQTYTEAVENVLRAEMIDRPDMLLLRVGGYPALAESEQEICLSRDLNAAPISIALGAAMAGAYPVLDLRMAGSTTPVTLPEACPPMTILMNRQDADQEASLTGLRRFAPKNIRQAAGFLRAALRAGAACLMLMDDSLAEQPEEVPDDPDFMLVPPDSAADELAPIPPESAAQDITPSSEAFESIPENTDPSVEILESVPEDDESSVDVRIPDGENAGPSVETLAPIFKDDSSVEAQIPARESAKAMEEAPVSAPEEDDTAAGFSESSPEDTFSPKESPTEQPDTSAAALVDVPTPAGEPPVFPPMAQRSISFDDEMLRSLCARLEAPRALILERCLNRLRERHGGFEWFMDELAESGETAFLPPEQQPALLWLGADRLTVCYDPRRLGHAEAAALLRDVRRYVEQPILLIYDKECDPA